MATFWFSSMFYDLFELQKLVELLQSDGERESLQLDDGQPTKQLVTEEPIKATEELK